MTDISSLIERARQSYRLHDAGFVTLPDDVFHDLVAELSRLTVSPPPEEIAGLCARLLDQRYCGQEPIRAEAAAALQQQARENERLHERLEDNHLFEHRDGKMVRVEVPPGSIPDGIDCRDETIKLQDERNDRLAARITELEDERDRLRDLVECKDCMEYAHRVAAAIRAKTREECAQIADKRRNGLKSDYGRGFDVAAESIALDIRALNQPESGGGE